MARAPNEKAAKAKELFIRGIKLVDIAKQLGLPEGTVRRWKSTYKWDSERSDKKSERSHRRGGKPGNKNAIGNSGGAAPRQNKNAEKHGFFSKYLPAETLDIISGMPKDPLDILWDQIQIQYAAIIRAQQIMYVRDREDKTAETTGDFDNGSTYIIQQAWDKQANFLAAQSRAMKTLESMINRYDDMLHKNWDMATEEQKARINHLKAQTENINKGNDQTNVEDKVAKLFETIGGALDAESK